MVTHSMEPTEPTQCQEFQNGLIRVCPSGECDGDMHTNIHTKEHHEACKRLDENMRAAEYVPYSQSDYDIEYRAWMHNRTGIREQF